MIGKTIWILFPRRFEFHIHSRRVIRPPQSPAGLQGRQPEQDLIGINAGYTGQPG